MTGVALLSALILTPIAQAVIVYVDTQEYIDRPTTLGQAFGYAFARFGSLLGSVFLAGLITFVGLLLFCIPGIYLSVAYAFVGQVVVLESLSGMDAFNRSRQLVPCEAVGEDRIRTVRAMMMRKGLVEESPYPDADPKYEQEWHCDRLTTLRRAAEAYKKEPDNFLPIEVYV